jgi:hypothetical protein
MAKYTLEVDYGNPYSEEVNSDAELKAKLLKLKDMAENEEVAYMDIFIFQGKKDVTSKMFKKLRLNLREW